MVVAIIMGDSKYTELSLPLCSESSSESSSKSSSRKRTAAKVIAGISGLVIFGYFMSATYFSSPEAGALNLVSSEARLPELVDQNQLELVSSPKLVTQLGVPYAWYGAITLSKDNSLAALKNYFGIEVWDVKTKKRVANFIFRDTVNKLLFTPDGKYLISSTSTGISIWSLETKSLHGQIKSETFISSTFVTSDSKLVAYKSSNGVSFWDISTLQMSHTLKVRDDSQLNDIAITPDRRYLAMAISGGENIIGVYDLSTMYEIATINTEIEPESVKISDDGQIVATVGKNGKSYWILNVQTGKLISNLDANIQYYLTYGLSPDGRFFWNEGISNVIIHDLKSNKKIREISNSYSRCVFTTDSKFLLATYHWSIKVLDLETGDEVATLGNMVDIYDFYQSENGEYLLVSTSESAYLWSLNN